MGKFRFQKQERLRSQRLIQELFASGSALHVYPVRLLHKSSDGTHHQVLFSVPKRSFKRAVDRNRIRRCLREAYRLNKHILATPSHLTLAYIYVGKDQTAVERLPGAVAESLQRLTKLYAGS